MAFKKHPISHLNQHYIVPSDCVNGDNVGKVQQLWTEQIFNNSSGSYSFAIQSGNTNNAFAIDGLTGELTVANAANFTADITIIVRVTVDTRFTDTHCHIKRVLASDCVYFDATAAAGGNGTRNSPFILFKNAGQGNGVPGKYYLYRRNRTYIGDFIQIYNSESNPKITFGAWGLGNRPLMDGNAISGRCFELGSIHGSVDDLSKTAFNVDIFDFQITSYNSHNIYVSRRGKNFNFRRIKFSNSTANNGMLYLIRQNNGEESYPRNIYGCDLEFSGFTDRALKCEAGGDASKPVLLENIRAFDGGTQTYISATDAPYVTMNHLHIDASIGGSPTGPAVRYGKHNYQWCYIKNCGRAFHMWKRDNTRSDIRGAYVRDIIINGTTNGDGFHFEKHVDSTFAHQDIEISRVEIRNPFRHGINLQQEANNIKISYVTVYGGGTTGIRLDNTVSGIKLHNIIAVDNTADLTLAGNPEIKNTIYGTKTGTATEQTNSTNLTQFVDRINRNYRPISTSIHLGAGTGLTYTLDADNNTVLNPPAIGSYELQSELKVPQGTTTIGAITPGQTTASVPYSYNNTDQTGFEYRLNTGNPVTASPSPIALTNLLAATQYTIEVRAINTNGPGTWSAPANFTTLAATAPAIPFKKKVFEFIRKGKGTYGLNGEALLPENLLLIESGTNITGHVSGHADPGEVIQATITEKAISDQTEKTDALAGTERVLVRLADGSLRKIAASFFTAGSNTDAVKSLMATGIIYGGRITINATDPSKIDIEAGGGYVVDDTVNPPILTPVTWSAFTAVALTDLLTATNTDLAINISGAVVQQRSFTNQQLRTVIFLGGVDHAGGTVNNTFSVQIPSFAPGLSVRDLARAVGDLNLDGNAFSAVGANLTVKKNVGLAFSFGRNTINDKNNPHNIGQPVLDPVSFNYIFRNGSGGTTVGALTSNINPANFDDGTGTLAAVPTNNFSFHQFLLFPNANKVFVQYGTATYNKMSDAISALSTMNFPPLVGFNSAMRRGVLIVQRGTTSLLDTTKARFFVADKYGSIAGAIGSGANAGGDMLASVYDPANGAKQVAFDDSVVKLTENQTVNGIKTFVSSPIAPVPTTEFQVATKGFVDRSTPKIYNVENYGAVHDGVTDDTAAIQAAINAAFNAGGGQVYFPKGIYIIAGPLQTNINGIDYNSQLYIPQINLSSTARTTIELVGEFQPNLLRSLGISTTVDPNTGVVLRSTIQGSGIEPAVIKNKGASENFEGISYTSLQVKNISIQLTPNASNKITMGGIDCYNSAIANFEYLTCFPFNLNLVNSGIPDVIDVTGISMPKQSTEHINTLRNCTVGGFTKGYRVGEHTSAYDAVAICCVDGFFVTKHNHLPNLSKISTFWCINSITIDTVLGGTGGYYLLVQYLAVEWRSAGSWYDSVNTIKDPSNHGIGKVVFDIVASSVGVDNEKFKKVGGSNIVCEPISKVITTQITATSYTLKYTDAFRKNKVTNASNQTITIPPASTVNFDIDQEIILQRLGAGEVTIVAGTGVTLNVPTGFQAKIKGQYDAVSLVQTAVNVWVIYGALAESV